MAKGLWGRIKATVKDAGDAEGAAMAAAGSYIHNSAPDKGHSLGQRYRHYKKSFDTVGTSSFGNDSYKKGGTVKRTGLAKVHKGEVVVPTNKKKKLASALKKHGLMTNYSK